MCKQITVWSVPLWKVLVILQSVKYQMYLLLQYFYSSPSAKKKNHITIYFVIYHDKINSNRNLLVNVYSYLTNLMIYGTYTCIVILHTLHVPNTLLILKLLVRCVHPWTQDVFRMHIKT